VGALRIYRSGQLFETYRHDLNNAIRSRRILSPFQRSWKYSSGGPKGFKREEGGTRFIIPAKRRRQVPVMGEILEKGAHQDRDNAYPV